MEVPVAAGSGGGSRNLQQPFEPMSRGVPSPKGPCTQIVYTLGPMYPYREYFSGQSIYYLGTWTLRVLGVQRLEKRSAHEGDLHGALVGIPLPREALLAFRGLI